MKILTHPVAGHTATIKVPETPKDLDEFRHWLNKTRAQPGVRFACDTETTGLDIFTPGFRVRTIQIGCGLTAWVIPIEELDTNLDWLTELPLTFHNAAYDLLAIRKALGIIVPWANVLDTKILAHLYDSRARKEGGPGHSLQELTATFISPEVAEDVKGSMTALSHAVGIKKGELFATIDLWNEQYLLYAGMDVILTDGVRTTLERLLEEAERRDPRFKPSVLIPYEHRLAKVCADMEWNGFLLDVDYSNQLVSYYESEQELWESWLLTEHGIESVNSAQDVAEALIESGVKLTELTTTGAWKLDKSILEPLEQQGNQLAAVVQHVKKLKKWRTSWVDKFLAQRDEHDRCHAHINPLQARTGRMSITGIPAQTLPSSDSTIRSCFIADPGQAIVSCDYAAQELRVLAGLSGDENMTNAFLNDVDLHQLTADASGVDRKVGKTVNFAYVYGSGPRNIADTCGISFGKARQVIQGFERTYPGVKALSDRLATEAETNGYIVTPIGRRLPVDKDRTYAALNYMIQSTSRDITASALIRLDQAGITPYLRLPIHDEVVASVPTGNAEACAQRIAQLMATEFGGVPIASDADVYGPSWGDGYK